VRRALPALTRHPAGLAGLWLGALALCLVGWVLLSGSGAAQPSSRVVRAGEVAAVELAPALQRQDQATLALQARALLVHGEIGFAWLRLRDAEGRAVAAAGRLESGAVARLPSGLRRSLYRLISTEHRVPLAQDGIELGTLEFGLLIGGGGFGALDGRMGLGLLALLLGVPALAWLSLRLKDSFQGGWSAGSPARAQAAADSVLRAGSRPAPAQAPAAASELLAVFDRGALFVDRNQSVQDLNPLAARLTGWSPAEARGRPLSEVLRLFRDDPDRQLPLPLEDCFSGAQPRLQARYTLRARDGSLREVDIDAGPVRDTTGYIGGVLVSLSEAPTRGGMLQRIAPASALAPEQERRQLSQMLLDQVLECVITTDSQDRIQFANGRALENFGYSLPELRGEPIARLLPQPFLRSPQARVADFALSLPGMAAPQVVAQRRDGSQYPATLLVHPVSFRGQQGHVLTVRPLGAPAGSHALGPRLRHLLENAPGELYVADPDSLHLVTANRRALEQLGFGVEQLRQTTLLRLCPQLAPETLRGHVARLREGASDIIEFAGRHQRADGSSYEVQSRLSLWTGEGAPLLLLVSQALTGADARPEVELREARLALRTHHDALTGLPSRTLFMERVAQAIGDSGRSGLPFALVHLTLSGLGEINRTQGYDAGDQALRTVADRLSAAVRASDTVARLGGVEFILLLQLKQREDIGPLLERLQALLAQPMRIGGQDLALRASAGAAVYPEDADTAELLMRHAGHALREARERGPGEMRRYQPGVTPAPAAPVEPAAQLREAQARGELGIQLQALIDVRARLVVGAEVLMAWRYPGHSLLRTAEQFTQAGGDPAQAGALALWALEQACEQQANWRNLELHALPLLVNLSALPLPGRQAAQAVRGLLARYRVPPEQLIVMAHAGALESLLVDADSWLPVLRDLGLRFGVHDVDAGRIDLLRRADVDVVRLTPRSIAGLPASREASEHSAAIIQAGQRVGARIYASGVERAEQREALLALGCPVQQGRLFGEPQTPQEFARSLVRAEAGAL
jgi:diguanylate cyclase (GGDEF)-like protein/PAS domain S-box-containing protein